MTDELDPFVRTEEPPREPARVSGHRRFGARSRTPSLFEREAGLAEAVGDVYRGEVPERRRPVDHHRRAGDWLRANGYFDARSEYEVTTYSGVVYKKDLFGFADRVAVKNGGFYAFQLCTARGKNAHLRKLVSREPVKGFQQGTYEENVRGFLDHGGKLFLMVFDQLGGKGTRWTMDLIEVTHELLDTVAGRRRKHKQRR